MIRFDGPDGHDTANVPDPWRASRRAALGLIHAAEALQLRPGSETVVGTQALIDALDHYWQARYGGRVVVVSAPEPER